MPDLGHYQPPANSASSAGPNYTFHSGDRLVGVQHQAARRTPLSSIHTAVTTNSLNQRKVPSPTAHQLPHHTQASIPCIKPLPSVPQDVDADDDLDVDGTELVHQQYNDSDNHIESDISSTSASSAASSFASSSMDANWHETSLRNQVARLHIQYTDVDLAQTEAPSVFGLRRRIVAAALDHVAQNRQQDGDVEGLSRSRRFVEKGMLNWLAVQQPNSSQWKGKILRKKISFGKKQAKAALAGQSSAHDPMPNGVAVSASASTGRSRSSSTTGSAGSYDKMLKRDKELAEREVDFDLVVLSRFETAELKMTVYTEHRQGSWVIKGPAQSGATVLDEPPLVYSPWDCQIDSRAIVERKKLRSFIELSDTTCNVRCAACSSSSHHDARQAHSEAFVACRQCEGSGAVQTTYVVCVTLRQSTFLPLNMPARHRSGKLQNAFRSYLPKTTAAMSHIDVLRMRSLEAVRSCALRVGRAHHREHDARLLMAKAVLERRSCNSVAVINRTNGMFRTFDVTDGGCIRGGAGLIEEDSRIVETPEIADALSQLPVTTVVHPETTHKFVDLELVDMASSKQLSFIMERSPSIYTSSGSTCDSYSPSAFSFFQRASDGGSTSRDSTLRGVQPNRSQTAAAGSLTSSGSAASSLRSFASAQERASGGMVAPRQMSGSTASMLSGMSSRVSSRTVQSWETAPTSTVSSSGSSGGGSGTPTTSVRGRIRA
ncbi:uncharacterized protein SPSC_03313 [Sporisorium scitamineum]|uniref:Uncharacterized protein n=2 Tax=Sporisorium scitamineum TaxID=49012 RepID=A0A127ZE41_9BASI|nr:uncharacterized protein SPSC_03313 [Sporisorium scitamineum]